MEEKLLGIKAAIAVFFSAVGALLGWRGVMVCVWILAMALDYISGSCAAAKNGEWSSTTARQGLWHKGGMISVVLVAAIADLLFVYLMPNIPIIAVPNHGYILPLVLAWYIITEAGSVLENAVKLGAKVPSWLVKLLEIGLSAVNKGGEDSGDTDDKD